MADARGIHSTKDGASGGPKISSWELLFEKLATFILVSLLSIVEMDVVIPI